MHRELGITILLVSHSMEDVAEYVDRIIVMNDGQIDAIGRHEELLATNAIYQEVYEMQTQGKGEADEN